MLNGKYSKVLTVILIVAILAIIGLLIYIGIDWYKSYTTEVGAGDAVAQFDSWVNNSQGTGVNGGQPAVTLPTDDTLQPDVSIQNIIDPVVDDGTGGGTSGGSGSSSGNSSSGSGTSGGSGSTGSTLMQDGFPVVGKIEIPKANIEYTILGSYVPEALEKSICWLWGPGLNQVGNNVLIGHNYRDSRFFGNNNRLQEGDKIYITDTQGKRVTYSIYKKYTTDTNDFTYADRDTQGRREISLSTCTNDTKARIIIWARED